MADLMDLAKSMTKLAAKIPDFGNEVAKQTGKAVLSDLTQVTPIDTGEAVSNWQVSLDAPEINALPAFAPSPKGRVKAGVWVHKIDPVLTAQANVPPTVQAGQAVIDSKAPGQPLFITNNSDHIELLDQGSSDQAPAGFVDRAVMLGNQIAQAARLRP